MRIPVLLRNETIKATHYLPVLVTFGSFAGLLCIAFGQMHYASTRPGRPAFQLPGAWDQILGEPLQIATFFLSVLVVLLVSNEFSWRTARQNVIDGLSKEQWFAAKVLLLPLLALCFFAILVGLGAFFASLGKDLPTGDPVVARPDIVLMAAFLLSLIGFASVSLFIGSNVRSSGSAIGLLFLYTAIVERLIGAALGRGGDTLAATARFLPVSIFGDLLRRMQWDPVAFERAVNAATRNARPVPELMDSAVLVGAALAWIIVLLTTAFLIFRRRDL